MNTKQKRTLRVLVSAAAVLTVVFIGVKVIKGNAAKTEAEAVQAAAEAGILTDTSTSYNALTYYNGSATLSFEKNDEGNWFWTNDAEFPLEQSYLVGITETLASLKPQQTITDGDTLDAYGLNDPSQTLTATAENGETTTIALGNTTTDKKSYYMLMNGAQSPVYIISDALAGKISFGIFDMMRLPETPALTEEQLTSITISGEKETILTATQAQAQEAPAASASGSSAAKSVSTTWTYGETDVTGSSQVSAIVKQILGLKLDACVDYRPSKGAASLCGFDAPAAVITVNYTGESKSSQTLTLTVGGRVLDGDGRYIRINDDTTVYRMSADKLDTLMKVSVNGLSTAQSTSD